MRTTNTATNNDLTIFNTFGKGNLKSNSGSNNCVIYTRVSTKEQADNNMSLTTQKKACELYASKHGYPIAGCFGGTYESAKNDERKEFNKMLSFVKKSREQVSFIIVYSVDRFSRSGANAIFITEQLKKSGVRVISVTQPTDASTSSGSLQQNIQYIFSEYDNQLRREKCMSGVKEALLRGEWCHGVPLGFDVIRREGKRLIVVNETGKLLKKAFLLKANDNLSSQTIRQKLNALGLKLSHQQISKMFRNPFYCGLISHAALEGKVVEGKQEVLISKEIFLKVNDLLQVNTQGYTVKHENDAIPMKNFLRCDQCNTHMPGYVVKKKNLWYYKCRTIGCCNNKSVKQIHNKFLSMLEPYQLSLSDKATQLIKKQVVSNLSSHIEQRQSEAQLIQNNLFEINHKIDRIEERFILDEITKEQYLKFTDKFKQERIEINRELEKCTSKVSNLESSVDKLIEFSSNLPSLWTSSDYSGKVKLQNLVFPNGITYNKKNDQCRTSEINPLFSYIAHLKGVLNHKKIGINDVSFNYSDLVELQGIEPWSGVGNDGAFYMFIGNYCRVCEGLSNTDLTPYVTL